MKTSFGDKGYLERTTGTITGSFYCIFAAEESTVDIVNSIGDDSTGLTIPGGVFLPVTATSITINSGKILAFNE